MRDLMLLVICCAAVVAVWAAEPEPIEKLSVAMYSLEYYEEQAEEWATQTQVTPEAEEAWLNYYTAARNSNVLRGYATYDQADIIAQVGKHLPDSFVFYYLTYWQSGLFTRDYSALMRAHAIAPERMEVAHDLIHYYELRGDRAKYVEWCERYYATGELSPGILNWNYNALASVRENGVLLTQGDNDTYPAWVLQEVKGVRSDVLVTNVYLLLAERGYRTRIFKDLGIPDDFERAVQAPVHKQIELLLRHMTVHCARPLHLGIATPEAQRVSLGSQLYVTGLAFAHSERYLDNVRLLRSNYEQAFLTEQLSNPLFYDRSQTVVDHMNMNYIPALAILHELYQKEGAQQKAAATAEMAVTIGRRQHREEEVARMFVPLATTPPVTTHIDLRAIDKALLQVQDQLYASAYEVNNADYQLFLEDLLAAKRFDLLEVCKTENINWRSLLPEAYHGLSDAALYDNGGRPDGDKHPIVSISHAAAQAYCEWLTEVYNASDHRRKRFQEVRFRLPTEEEWEVAARGGRKWAPYPWGGPYNQNVKGCYLANFNPYLTLEKEETSNEAVQVLTGEAPDEDGSYFTAPVDAYFPNDAGFYNMSGNVSEMTQQPGVTKGGGWLDAAYYTQISTTQTEVLPSANVGFRIFVEVIK